MRNFGSGALQLAHVACGRLDGFIELQLSIWDAIGALVIVDEAGGRSAPFMPSPSTAKAPCLASTPGIFDALARMSGYRRRDGERRRATPFARTAPRYFAFAKSPAYAYAMPAGSTYLRSAAFADRPTTAAIAASIFAELRPRAAEERLRDERAGERVVLRARDAPLLEQRLLRRRRLPAR